MAGSAFKDAEVLKVLSGFTPILIDKDSKSDADKAVLTKYRVGGIPHTAFADAKGEAVGAPVIGAVPTEKFLQIAEGFAKKIKPGKPSKDFATLTAAKAELDQATAKKQVAPALAAIAKIEKVNRPGAILDAALGAKKVLLEEGRKRLDACAAGAKGEAPEAALKDLKKIAQEYKGTEIGEEAAKVVKELEPPTENGAK